MSAFSKLRSHFYAAMPVIGPHADIECELLLAGKKPVGFLFVHPEGAELHSWRDKKQQRDVRLLDRAVSVGKLKSMDEAEADPQYMFKRFYCQPGREADMAVVHAIEGGGDISLVSSCKKDWDELLGYRKRDVAFFARYMNLPESFRDKIQRVNNLAQRAYQQELLRQCGIDPDQWVQQLRAEHILD